ncbi:MAG: LysR family transcriptional regulator [Pseudomonadota bacterium]
MDMSFQWDGIRALLAVAKHGSLLAAAAELDVSQPTLGRRIDALEAALALRLLDRGPRGVRLTPAGTALLRHAGEMEAAAGRLHLAAIGQSEAISGTVRITAPMVISHFHLPTILTDLVSTDPGLEVELIPTDSTQNLLLREADIAIRMYRPTQWDLITRKVADLPLGLYAAHSYLAEHGPPAIDVLDRHHLVGYDRDPMIITWMRHLGIEPHEGLFRVRTDDQAAYWRLVVAGAGIGANQRSIGDHEPAVARVLPDLDLPTLPVWLVSHADLMSNRLIRRTFDHLATALGRIARS